MSEKDVFLDNLVNFQPNLTILAQEPFQIGQILVELSQADIP